MKIDNRHDEVETTRFNDEDPDSFVASVKYGRDSAVRRFTDEGELRKPDVPAITIKLPDGALFHLSQQSVITVGRIDLTMNIEPTLDLTKFNGQAKGVSRIHAKIVYVGDTFHVFDLESTNGTYVNGARIAARQPVPLMHGDVVSFGYLDTHILLNDMSLDDTEVA